MHFHGLRRHFGHLGHLGHADVDKRMPAPDFTTVSGQVMSVVYTTASQTFTGSAAGYTTYSDQPTPTQTQQAYTSSPTEAQSPTQVYTPPTSAATTSAPATTASSSIASSSSSSSVTSTSKSTTSSSSSSTSSSTTITSSSSVTTSARSITTYPTTSYSTLKPAYPTTLGSGSGNATSSDGGSSGMSTGAKAGLAVSMILIAGGVLTVALFFLHKKKKQKEQDAREERETREAIRQKKLNEKKAAAAAATAAAAANSPKAPRLSLRPVSRLVPDLLGGRKNRLSQEQQMATFDESKRPRDGTRDNPFQDPPNPFADPEKQAGLATSPPTAEGIAPGPIVAPGPGADSQGNVYRILMDFNPTMSDELGLRAGQHVRMLHEYDDGWALCIKLDRSQQGVVPRTCLAAKPSKPRSGPGGPPGFRPGQPPSGHNSPAMSRPITPNGPPRRGPSPPTGPPNNGPIDDVNRQPIGPNGRPSSPGAFNQSPRPLSPGPRPQKRSQSPGPYGASGPAPMGGIPRKRRSNSASAPSAREPRNSPPGPSKLRPGPPQAHSNSPGLAM